MKYLFTIFNITSAGAINLASTPMHRHKNEEPGRGGESMRGKLRDKRATGKRDVFKREVIERRRTTKRDNRPLIQVDQFDDENYELETDEVAEEQPAPDKK